MATSEYSRVWTFQKKNDVEKHGPKKAAWYVGWYDQNGKRRAKKIGSKTAATKYAREFEPKLNRLASMDMAWAEFREEYEADVLSLKRPGTQEVYRQAFAHIERVISPKRLVDITDQTLDQFVAVRTKEKASPATINKELRALRVILRKACKRKHLDEVPDMPFLREPSKIPTFLTDEQLAQVYAACDGCEDQKYWQALLVFLRMTGWRIGEALALKWNDVDFDRKLAITRAEDNKGHKDSIVPLHALVLEHLMQLNRSTDFVFPWLKSHKLLLNRFHELQQSAEVCKSKDVNTYFGFHDVRRAFATNNAMHLSAQQLKTLMRHASYSTTERYINMAHQLNGTADKLSVPKLGGAGGMETQIPYQDD